METQIGNVTGSLRIERDANYGGFESQEALAGDKIVNLDNKVVETVPTTESFESPIDGLKPNSEKHAKVLRYLLDKLDRSERTMNSFYTRWQNSERRLQAYIKLSDYEEELKSKSDASEAPKAVSIVVPYAYATHNTIVTYLTQVFGGRKPFFQVGTYDGNELAARNMETVLQYNCEQERMLLKFWNMFRDAETYGVGIIRTEWNTVKRKRTAYVKEEPNETLVQMGLQNPMELGKQRREVDTTVFEGTKVTNLSPYLFFPDTRVPMYEVNTRGEFVFWRSFEGLHMLKIAEADGSIKFVDSIRGTQPPDNNDLSEANKRAGSISASSFDLRSSVQLDQGCVRIIPAELGLSPSTQVETWIFSILNKKQIVQAEPYTCQHGYLPVAVTEPYALGYNLGNLGIVDFESPIQDLLSWFINSHIYNVRSTLNNTYLVNPSLIEMQDLKTPGPGKIIRLKRAAYGMELKQAIQQMPVVDVTQGHVNDLAVLMRIGDQLSAVTDAIRGIQSSGRKSATEVRTTLEGASSRLACHAQVISSQAVSILSEQMCLNAQQYMSEEFYVKLLGQNAAPAPISVNPEMLVGDFHFPINDGTLPIDRTNMIDVWKEIFMAVAKDPVLRGRYNLDGIFEYVAGMSGAQGLSKFRMQGAGGMPQQQPQPNIQFMPDQQMAEFANNGQYVPVGQGIQGLG